MKKIFISLLLCLCILGTVPAIAACNHQQPEIVTPGPEDKKPEDGNKPEDKEPDDSKPEDQKPGDQDQEDDNKGGDVEDNDQTEIPQELREKFVNQLDEILQIIYFDPVPIWATWDSNFAEHAHSAKTKNEIHIDLGESFESDNETIQEECINMLSQYPELECFLSTDNTCVIISLSLK